MREMKDSKISFLGEVPKEWKEIPIRFVFDEVLTKNKLGVEKLALKFTYGTIIPKKDFNADEDEYVAKTILNYTVVKPGTIMINCLNLNFDFISQRVGLVKNKGVITSAYLALLPGNSVLPEYASYEFKAFDFIKAFHNMGTGVRKTLDFSELGKKYFLLPPLDEQRKIVHFLNHKLQDIDEIILTVQNEVELLNIQKKAIITEAVTEGLSDKRSMAKSNLSWMPEYPSNWILSKLKYFGTLQNGISKGGEFFGDGYPFVSYGDVYKNITLPTKVAGLIMTSCNERTQYSVRKNDAFFTRTSENLEEIGLSSVCEKTIDDAVFAGFLIRFRPTSEMLNMRFYKYYFRSEKLRLYYVTRMMIVTRASLSQQLLGDMPILVPPMEEQNKIAEYLDEKCAEIDKLIEQKEEQLKNLEEYKQSLVYEYVTGKKKC